MSNFGALVCLVLVAIAISIGTLGVSIAALVAQNKHNAAADGTKNDDGGAAIVVNSGSRMAIEMAAVGVEELSARAAFRRLSLFGTDLSAFDAAAAQPAHPGPLRVARAMAIINVAMSDAVAASTRLFQPYSGSLPFVEPTQVVSICAAVATAGRLTMRALYPSFLQRIEAEVGPILAAVVNGEGKTRGIEVGRRAAELILAERQGDGSEHQEPAAASFESSAVGAWRRDPIARHGVALGALWAQRVSPFVIDSASQFRAPPPATLDSTRFRVELDEVRSVGGDNVTTPTARDEWGSLVGVYWAYDGTGNVCAPPRLYIQLAFAVADQHTMDLSTTVRTIGTLALTMADAGLAAWESKYFYRRGRPVTVIRELERAAGGDPNWTPLGAPASNSRTPNFTPPFPAYPSGHAVFGGALAQVLRHYVGNDTFTVRFVSSEYDGVTRDSSGALRPFVPRDFSSATQIEAENGDSRIKLGIHWRSDSDRGIEQGRAVARYIVPRVFPLN